MYNRGMELNSTAAARHEAKVDRTTTPDGCHEWTARRDKDGYGKLRATGDTRRPEVPAHRIAFVLGGGVIPPGHQVLHHCDNPPCQRFDHLFTGTAADNNADKARKGRSKQGNTSETAVRGERWHEIHAETHARGKKNGNARLSEATVKEIRFAVAGGESQGSVGRRLGVPQAHVSRIVRRQSWAHVL